MELTRENCCEQFADHINQFGAQEINFFRRMRPLLTIFGKGIPYVDDAINHTLKLLSLESKDFDDKSTLKEMHRLTIELQNINEQK